MWRCVSCETENPLEVQICTVCGSPFAETVRTPDEARPERDPGMTAMFSLFLPGAGHAYLGLWGQAISRAVLSVWVVGTALVAAVQGSAVIAAIFGLAALALWVIAAHDAYRDARGEGAASILKGRAFLYVVMGLLGFLLIALFGTALQARSA